jgi:hypothetical protein
VKKERAEAIKSKQPRTTKEVTAEKIQKATAGDDVEGDLTAMGKPRRGCGKVQASTAVRRMVSLGRAGERAMEEEAERTNPLDGGRKGRLSKEAFLKRMAEGKAKKRGSGATPSMGLSRVRGGGACAAKPSAEKPSRIIKARAGIPYNPNIDEMGFILPTLDRPVRANRGERPFAAGEVEFLPHTLPHNAPAQRRMNSDQRLDAHNAQMEGIRRQMPARRAAMAAALTPAERPLLVPRPRLTIAEPPAAARRRKSESKSVAKVQPQRRNSGRGLMDDSDGSSSDGSSSDDESVKGGRKKKWIQEAVSKMKHGAFTKEALKHKMTPEEFADEVMANPEKYSKTTKKRAQFLINIRKKGSGHIVGGAIDEFEAAKLREPPVSHAHTLGVQMASHLMEHHGGRFMKEFGAGYYSTAAPAPQQQPERSFGEKIKNEFVNPQSKLRGEILPKAADVAGMAEIPLNLVGAEFGDPLLGTQIKSGATALNAANKAATAVQNIVKTGENFQGIDSLRDMYRQAGQAFNAANQVRDLVANPRRLPGRRGRGGGDEEDDDEEFEELSNEFIEKINKEALLLLVRAALKKFPQFINYDASSIDKASDSVPELRKMAKTIETDVYGNTNAYLDWSESIYKKLNKKKFLKPDSSGPAKKGRGRPRKTPALKGDTVVLEGGKRRRAKAGPSDKRRNRASIVSEVMKKRGVSLIEASKIVKKEGLY